MDLRRLGIKAKKILDHDPDAIFETDIEEGRLLICRTGIDKDDYRVSLEKQIEIEDDDGNFDEECEEISECGSSLEEIEEIIEYYLEEGGKEESIC